MSYLIIELETQLLKTGKTSADLIRATGHTPATVSYTHLTLPTN
mgnify:CR=1 FL=1